MPLTPDAQAILLLCSRLGLPSNAPTPLTLREWNPLARRLDASDLKRPGALLGLSAGGLQRALNLSPDEAGRYARLLERGGTLALELERLNALGIWVLTRADEGYPARLRLRLNESAPLVLFGAGKPVRLGQPGLAVVGSRNINEAQAEVAQHIGETCAKGGLIVYSGGARGVDTTATGAALAHRGQAVEILADSLEKVIRGPETWAALARHELTLLTPYSPNAPFSAGAALGRNRLIYTMADYALVIASDLEKGGTWAGATEALQAGWVPVFVLQDEGVSDGNRRLLALGGRAFPPAVPVSAAEFPAWLASQAALPVAKASPPQSKLF
jgi:DNA processing protein